MIKKKFVFILSGLLLFACSTDKNNTSQKDKKETKQQSAPPSSQSAKKTDETKNQDLNPDLKNKTPAQPQTVDSVSLPPQKTPSTKNAETTQPSSLVEEDLLSAVLEGASGLYMSFFTDNPLEKIKIELAHKPEDSSFDFRIQYKYDPPYETSAVNRQTCKTYPLSSFPQSLILMEEIESYGFFSTSNDLWSVTLRWPSASALSFQKQNKENAQIHIEEISFKMEEDFNWFSDNTFTVIPDSIEIKQQSQNISLQQPWVFKPKETAYEQFFPIECP